MSERPAGALTHFIAYLNERFPPGVYGLLIATFWAAASWIGQSRVQEGQALIADPKLIVGALVAFLFFFHLRVFDENKDFEADRLAHPKRVLSRGLVTLKQLNVLGGVAIGLQALLTATLGPWALLTWGIALLWSLAMRFEFFCGDFLKRHTLLYLISHNPVVALLALFGVASGQRGEAIVLGPAVLIFLAQASWVSMLMEVGRKVRAPEDEHEEQETYSQSLGVTRASVLGVVLTLLATGTSLLLGRFVGFSHYYQVGWLALGLWNLVVWVRYAIVQERGPVKQVAAVTGLTMLVSFLLVAAELALAQGLTWSSAFSWRWSL